MAVLTASTHQWTSSSLNGLPSIWFVMPYLLFLVGQDVPDDWLPAALEMAGYHFQDLSLIGFQPVLQGDKHLGTLYLKLDTGDIMHRWFWDSIGIAVVVLGIVLLVAYLISKTLQKQISQPILFLAETAKTISDHQDFSVRAQKHARD